MKPLTLFVVIVAAIVVGFFAIIFISMALTQPMTSSSREYAESVKAKQEAKMREIDREIKRLKDEERQREQYRLDATPHQ